MEKSNITWKAYWIWDAFHRYTTNCYALLRRKFPLTDIQAITEIKIFCAGSSEYKLFLNGKYLGRGSIPSQVEFQYYDEYSFTHQEILQYFNRENVLAVIGYNYGTGLHYRPHSPAGFLLQMEIRYLDGQMEWVVSDRTWKIAIPECWEQNAPQMFWTMGFQEIVDLSKYNPGFAELEFDDLPWNERKKSENNIDPAAFSGDIWDYVVEIGQPPVSPWSHLIPRDIPRLLEIESYPLKVVDYGACKAGLNICKFWNIADVIAQEEHLPINHHQVEFMGSASQNNIVENIVIYNCQGQEGVFIVFDFGREVVGYPGLEFSAEGFGIIDLGYSECLDQRKRVDPARQGIKQADRLRFKTGSFRWEMFNRRAFRYLQVIIRGIDQPVVLHKVWLNGLHYPFEKQGYFQCSNEVLNKIYETSKHTLAICMKENYEDCPLREHAQYLGDLRVEALMNYYAFGDLRLIAKGLRQFAREQRSDGWFKSLAPGSTAHNIVDYLPLWVIALWDYYLFSGDRELFKELYGCMNRLMQWLKSQTDNLGLLSKRTDWWVFIDWADLPKKNIITALQCFYYKSLVDAAKIARVCGDKMQQQEYFQEAVKVKRSINTLLWNEEKGAYVDYFEKVNSTNESFSIQTNCLAVIFNIADKKQRERIRKFLNENNLSKVKTGYFKYYELEALFKLNILQKFRNAFSYWEEMLKRGASTWWECFDPGEAKTPEVSLCHGWSASPLTLLGSRFLGVIPVKPGFLEFLVKPSIFELEWMEGLIHTVRGDIEIKCSRKGNGIELICNIPEGTVAHILIPIITAAEDTILFELNSCRKLTRLVGHKYVYCKLEGGLKNRILVRPES